MPNCSKDTPETNKCENQCPLNLFTSCFKTKNRKSDIKLVFRFREVKHNWKVINEGSNIGKCVLKD